MISFDITDLDEAAAREPDRHLDRLLRYLWSQADTELDRWAIESLSEGLELSVMITSNDPITHVWEAGKSYVSALSVAGSVPARRGDLVRMVVEHVGDLLAMIKDWKAEQDEDASLAERWGCRPVHPVE